MSAETALVAATLAITIALGLVLPARPVLRRLFGAAAAYAAWPAVPLAVAAALLPLPRAPVFASLAAAAGVAPHAVSAAAGQITPSAAATLLVAIWLAGALAALTVLVLRQRRFDAALGPLRRVAHGRRHASHASAGPLVTGLIAPRIVLPADFRVRYTPRERRLIVAHEGAHVRGGDVRVNAVAALVRCLFWFHPLVYVAHARFRLDQELARDANVMARFPEARRCYAGAMLKTQMAVAAPKDRRTPLGCGWHTVNPLKERINMLKHPLPGRSRRRFGGALAALLSVGVAFGAWAAKPVERAFVEARLVVRIDDGEPQNVRLIGPLGEPFEVRLGEGPDAWRVQFVATDDAPAMLRFAGQVHLGDTLVASPAIVMREGVAGRVQVTTADGLGMLDIETTFTRTDRATPDEQTGDRAG